MAVVTRKTGLGADVIRAWERRYGAISPARTPGNRRLYSDDDVRRLVLLRQALDAGWQISQVANLTDDELRERVGSQPAVGDAGAPTDSPTATGGERATPHLAACVAALRDLDDDALRDRLERAAVELGRVELLDRLVVPIVQQVGEGCASGDLRTVHEHLCSTVLRSFLDGLRGAYPVGAGAPGIVVSTPPAQHHELGALVVAAVTRIEGWRTTYLGPNLPVEEIAMAAGRTGARAVALSLVFPGDDSALPDELRRLARALDDDITLLVGGAAAPAYTEVLDEIRATVLADLTALRGFLRSARFPSPGGAS